MKLFNVILFFSIAILFSGCNSNSTEFIQIEKEEMIRVSGALNTSLYSDITVYECQGIIKSWDIGNTLFLSIRAKRNLNNDNEQINLNLYIPLDSDEYPLNGKYYSYILEDNFCGVSYKSQWAKNSFSKYRFETGLVRIVIEENDNNHLIGKFSLSANQSYGQRILNGQVEDIKLANKGEITVSGKIDVVLNI